LLAVIAHLVRDGGKEVTLLVEARVLLFHHRLNEGRGRKRREN
jgi:hypothetical protein